MRNDGIALTFFVMSLSGSIWFLCTAMGYLSRVPQVGIFWFKIDNVGVVFLSSTVYAFVVTFLGLFNKRKHYVVGGYLISAVFAVLTLTTNWMDTGVEIFFWGYFPKWGFLSRIFFPFFFVYMVFSFIELFARLRVEENQKIKNQIVYFLFAFGMAYTSSIDYFATFGIPIYPASFISMGAYFFIIAYAVTKHRLLNISLAISRTAAWIISASFLGVLYLVLVMLYRTFIFPGVDTVFITLSVLYGIAAGVSFQNIRFFVQTGADKAFIKGWYDYRKVQRKITSELRRAFSIDDVVSVIKKNLDEQVDISRVSVLMPDKAGDFASPEMRIPADSDLIKTMMGNREILLKNESPALPDELCVPCFSVDELSALIILGKKRSEDPYNEQDFDLLETISDEISDAIFRIKPYEEVKTEYENTQKKLVETEKMLARSARLASLATLTAGVTHEIRNPLGIIRMGIDKLDDEQRSVEYLKEFKAKYLKHVDRIASIIDRMLYLSKAKTPVETEIDINSLIKEYIIELVAVKNVRIETQLSDIPKIKGISDDIYQVIINLTNNAVKAMPDGGTLIYKTYTGEENSHKTAVLEVIDTGIGIPKENLEKIFDPFFSTYHEGTGLGLAISHKIIVDLHGRIEVESVVGKGSTFKVVIPAFNT